MGLFDRFKKKPEAKQPSEEYQTTAMNQQVFRDATQEVAMFMYQVGITSQPGLSFFNDDKGILEGLFIQHTTNPDILTLKKMSADVYLQVVGMHAFGAGAYVTAKQLDFKHPVNEFTSAEMRQIALDFQQTDSYELALNRLGVPVNSKNKQVLDQIIVTGMKTAKSVAGTQIMEAQNIKAYMQVLYNAGISMYMLRKTN